MTEASPYKPPADTEPVRRWRLRWWFLSGFFLVFCFLLFFGDIYPLNMSGDAVFRCKLWNYYLIEIRHAWDTSGTLGPSSGSLGTTLWTFFEHLLISAVAGLLLAGVGKVVRSFRK